MNEESFLLASFLHPTEIALNFVSMVAGFLTHQKQPSGGQLGSQGLESDDPIIKPCDIKGQHFKIQ